MHCSNTMIFKCVFLCPVIAMATVLPMASEKQPRGCHQQMNGHIKYRGYIGSLFRFTEKGNSNTWYTMVSLQDFMLCKVCQIQTENGNNSTSMRCPEESNFRNRKLEWWVSWDGGGEADISCTLSSCVAQWKWWWWLPNHTTIFGVTEQTCENGSDGNFYVAYTLSQSIFIE